MNEYSLKGASEKDITIDVIILTDKYLYLEVMVIVLPTKI